MSQKCQFPDDMVIKPDGLNELDPCILEGIETHTNCTVFISRCIKCGKIDISWIKNEGCESFDPRTNKPLEGTFEERNKGEI